MQVWTVEDWGADRCTTDQIGKPVKQETFSPEQTVESLPPATMAELKQAALRVARGTGSYDEFLRANPGFHQKFLLSMVKEPVIAPVTPLTVIVSWIDGDRLSYKRGSTPEVITDVSPPAVAWKEPVEDSGLASAMRWEANKPKD